MPPVALYIDPSRTAGAFRAVHGVNDGPYDWDGLIDTSDLFRLARFPDVRLHDVHHPARDAVDISVIYLDMRNDPRDPGSYRFLRTDHYLQTIADCGCTITYRLGEAIDHHPHKLYSSPPRDFARWAEVCLGIARHYSEGWAGGTPNLVQRWEVWNEPDQAGPNSTTWQGTFEDYFRLYEVTATTLKRHNPALRVGGPAMTGAGFRSGFLEQFLGYCRDRQLPLDFCSWHTYTANPRSVADDARTARAMLDRFGYGKAENLLTEWHYFPPGSPWDVFTQPVAHAVKQQMHAEMTGARSAAFTAATLLLLQDAPLDMAHFYMAERMPFFGLFGPVGVPLKPYHAMRAFANLIQGATRLELDAANLPDGLFAAAGKAGNTIRVLLVNHTDAYRRLSIHLADQPFPFARSQILSSEHDLAAWPVDPDGCLLPPWSVVLLQP